MSTLLTDLIPRTSCTVLLERLENPTWDFDATDRYLIRTMLEKVEKEYDRLDQVEMLEKLVIPVKCCKCGSIHNVMASELSWSESNVKYYRSGTLRNATIENSCDCDAIFSFVIDISAYVPLGSTSVDFVKFSGINCELVEV